MSCGPTWKIIRSSHIANNGNTEQALSWGVKAKIHTGSCKIIKQKELPLSLSPYSPHSCPGGDTNLIEPDPRTLIGLCFPETSSLCVRRALYVTQPVLSSSHVKFNQGLLPAWGEVLRLIFSSSSAWGIYCSFDLQSMVLIMYRKLVYAST